MAEPVFEQLNLPAGYRQLVVNRETIYQYQSVNYRVEPGAPPTPVWLRMVRARNDEPVRLVKSQPAVHPTAFQVGLTNWFVPARGFRAPILDAANDGPLPGEGSTILSSESLQTAKWINDRLAHEGLLKTLAGALVRLGPDRFVTNGRAGLVELSRVGFPDDLLACFASGGHADPVDASLEVVRSIAQALAEGADTYEVEEEFKARQFRFPSTWSQFEVATESGTHEIGLLRMQAGGGFVSGIVPGGGIDVISKLVSALPHADFIVSIPEALTTPLSEWAEQLLRLNRRHQMTLIAEPAMVELWAQDNGKAGSACDPLTGHRGLATLAPRYASRLEGVSTFMPGESFLMDGLQAAGHRVIHSPLLFQGGNMLAVDDPRTGRRLLLLGEGVVHRNVALGLTRAQVREAFRRGFGVDECVVLPGVSYHLDFDVSIREVSGELIAFVNDPITAARVIVELGISAFEQHAVIDKKSAAELRLDLVNGDGTVAHERLSRLVRNNVGADGRFDATTAAMFKSAGVDSAEGNLQVFLQALDLLECSANIVDDPDVDPARRDYLRALRQMERARQAQLAALKSIGLTIRPVPSSPGLNRSINYLNGIQHAGGYILPVFGGFYSPLDDLAERAFRNSIGPQPVIRRIQCAELQRLHGAVHCVAAAYPRILPDEGLADGSHPAALSRAPGMAQRLDREFSP